MARLTFVRTSPFGSQVNQIVNGLVYAQQHLVEIKKVADLLTAGGASPAGLEGSAEFGVASGQGAAFYTDLQSIIAGVNAIACLPDLDQGS